MSLANPGNHINKPTGRPGGMLFWPGLCLLTVLIFVTLYLILPAVGLSQVKALFTVNLIWQLAGGMIGLALYWKYLRGIQLHPDKLLIAFLMLYPLYGYILDLLNASGIPVRELVVNVILIALPAGIVGSSSFIWLWQKVPVFKYLAFYFALLTLYYFVNNKNAIDLLSYVPGMNYTSVSVPRYVSFVVIFAIQLLIGITFRQSSDKYHLFRKINLGIIWMMLIMSVTACIFYPLDILTVDVSGKRLQHIFIHPGFYAQFMNFMTLYLGGIYFYYKARKDRLCPLILITTVLSCVGLLFSITKTYIAILAVTLPLLILLNLFFCKNQQTLMRGHILNVARVLGLGTLVVLVLFFILMSTEAGNLLATRFQESQSQEWRFLQWERLMSDVDLFSNLLWGHGFTGAVAQVETLTYNVNHFTNRNFESMYIHNAYLEQFYDFGLPGLVWVIAFLLMAKDSLLNMIRPWVTHDNKTLYILILVMIINFMAIMGNSENFYLSNCPFWYFIIILPLMLTPAKGQSAWQNENRSADGR